MKTKLGIRIIALIAIALNSYSSLNGQCNNIAINISSEPNPNIICQGDLVSLEATWTTGGSGCDVDMINWYNSANDQLLETTNTNEAFSFSATQSIIIYAVLKDTNDGTIGTSDEETIDVNNNPLIVITSNPVEPICEGTIVDLTASGDLTWSYEWNDGSAGKINSNELPLIGNSTYSVTVEDSNGCFGDASKTLNVIPSPEIMFADETPSTCVDNEINFDACSSTGDGLQFTWSPDDAALSDVSSCNPSWNPGSAFIQNYTLTIMANNGCTDMRMLEATAVNNPMPGIGVGNPKCVGTPISLVNNGTDGNCTWTVDNNGIIINPNSCDDANLIVNTPGNYMVTLTITAGDCTESESIPVEVFGKPSLNPSGGEECEGVSISLDCGVTGGEGPYIYSWLPNNDLTGATSCTPTYIGSNTQSFNVTVTDANGCMGTNPVEVVAEILPNPQASITTDHMTICEGGMVTLIASGGNSCVWSSGETNCQIQTNALSIGSHSFNVTVTNADGCQDMTSKDIEVEPDPSVSIEESQSVFCTDQSFTFTANATEGVGAYEYQWSVDGNVEVDWSGSASTISGSFSLEGDHSYSVRVRTANGEGCGVSSPSEKNISIIKEPTPEIKGPIEICNNQQSLYYIKPADANDSQIDWDIPGNPVTTRIEEFGPVVFVQWGSPALPSYTLGVTDQVGIGSTECLGMDELEVSVTNQNARLPADIIHYPFNDLLIVKDSLASCYQWGYIDTTNMEIGEFDDEIYQAFPVGSINTNYVYWVKTWDGNCDNDACATYSFEIRESESFFTPEEERVFLVFPNPNDGNFQVRTNYLQEEQYELIVADVWGRVVYQKTVFPNLGILDEAIFLNRAASGLYGLVLLGENGKITRHHKIVVAH